MYREYLLEVAEISIEAARTINIVATRMRTPYVILRA